jgi:two-component sensor histidine kinase
MAFHELATNAVKHGALSRKDGRVEVTWYAARAQQAGRIDATISELLVQQLSPQGAVEGENFSQAGPEIIHSE